MCTTPFNAYRLASQGNDRAAQDVAVQDILMLPQRVLTRTGRGPGDGKRFSRTVRARCNAHSEQLRRRYDTGPPPRDHHVQLDDVVDTAPLVHRAEVAAPAASSSPCPDGEAAMLSDEADVCDSDEFGGDHVRAFAHALSPDVSDPDIQAAKRAQHHVQRGHMQKAAHVLHSTATMADQRQPDVQRALAALHPPLPPPSVIPRMLDDAPQPIVEDDKVLVKLLRRSDNGSASGPSGWGGNMLSSLAQSDLCRAGIIALLKDVINGNLPERARQLLLASRLVALSKPGTGKLRPIAVSELFYRLAGVMVVRKVTADAAALLAPHQLGVGVHSGAEQIVHSLQHSLADTGTRRALLKVDISNAFNSCDRARVLRQLYEQPRLSAMFRIADFGYAVPSQLLMQQCDGQHLLSSNGVRQGDALSAILFCLYLRDVLAKVSARAAVEVQGFFDDINVSGEPAEAMKAFTQLQQLLPEVGLDFNTAKSHFAYFHEAEAPLMHSTRATLASHDIQLHESWLEVVGAVVGRDEDAIRAGVAATLGVDEGTAACFTRLQLDALSVQSAMLILRQCAVPEMNYALRCMPPVCIEQQAAAFDDLVMGAAQSKLLLQADEVERASTLERLRVPLRHGGFGLTSARQTSPATFLGSMAAVNIGCCVCAIQPAGLTSAVHVAAVQLDREQHAEHRPRCARLQVVSVNLLPALPPSPIPFEGQRRLHSPAHAQPAGHSDRTQGLSAARSDDEDAGWRAGTGSPPSSDGTASVGVESGATDRQGAGAHRRAVPRVCSPQSRPQASDGHRCTTGHLPHVQRQQLHSRRPLARSVLQPPVRQWW